MHGRVFLLIASTIVPILAAPVPVTEVTLKTNAAEERRTDSPVIDFLHNIINRSPHANAQPHAAPVDIVVEKGENSEDIDDTSVEDTSVGPQTRDFRRPSGGGGRPKARNFSRPGGGGGRPKARSFRRPGSGGGPPKARSFSRPGGGGGPPKARSFRRPSGGGGPPKARNFSRPSGGGSPP